MSDEEKSKKRTKSYIGCNTCRRRKIGCDKTRPTCLNCKKSRFVCEGYDIKLNWLSQVKFDKYGTQLPGEQREETEFTRRSKVDFVKYPKDQIYEHYDEMDEDLYILQKAKKEQLSPETYISQGPFGLFQGKLPPVSISQKQQQQQQQQQQQHTPYNSNNIANNNKRKFTNMAPPQIQPGQRTGTKQQRIRPNKFQNTNQQSNFPIGDSFGGSEWLSTELIDGAMITASALNGDIYFIDLFNKNESQNQTDNNNSNTNKFDQNSMQSSSTSVNAIASSPGATSSTNEINVSTNVNVNGNVNTLMNSANHTSENTPAVSESSSTDNMHNTMPPNLMKDGNNQVNSNNNNSTGASQYVANSPFQQMNIFDTVPDEMLHMLFQGRHELDNSMNLPLNQQQQQQQQQQPHLNQSSIQTNGFKQQQQQQQQQTLSQSQSHSNNGSFSNNFMPNMFPLEETPATSSLTQSQDTESEQSTTRKSLSQQGSISGPSRHSSSVAVPDDTSFPNFINIHAGNGARMPQRVMEIKQNVKDLPDSLAINKFPIFPTTSFTINPMARYLLNYYIEDVADMMTVIPLAKNPWKFIYFPRAIMAIGELGSLGTTSNAKNCLLNALLAVSAFNLQSKFARGSNEMKFYVDLGVQLRQQATQFLNKCLEEDVLDQKYKDVLVAVLSMVTIDVVWGTMASCKIHLDHCEKIIEKKMTVKTKLSNKAIILHRIFSSLKLIQDSTCLDNIDKSEIFLNESNYKNFIIGGGNFNSDKERILNQSHNSLIGMFKGRKKYNKMNRSNSKKSNTDSEHRSNNYNDDNRDEEDLPPRNKGVFNEKITDNGKIRIEYIVNEVDEEHGYDSNNASRSNSTNTHHTLDGSTSVATTTATPVGGSGTTSNENNAYVHFNNLQSNMTSLQTENKNDNESPYNSENVANTPDSHQAETRMYGNIPAFIDITRTSFQPSKNKIDDKVISSDAIYGLPNSLILMFSEVVHLIRFKRYIELNNKDIPFFFGELSQQLEYKLLNWKLEWKLTVDDNLSTPGSVSSATSMGSHGEKKNFISARYEGIYHHVMSFYHGLIIYFYRFVEDVNPIYLQEMVEYVLFHLNEIQRIVDSGESYIIPLFWQGFIAGSEAMTLFLQKGFNTWGQNIAISGIGTYWNARQIMLETWRRKNQNVPNSSWVDVLRDWKTNVMLT